MPQNNTVTTYLKNYLQVIKEAASENEDVILKHILNKNVKDTTKTNLLNSIIALGRLNPTLIKNIDKFSKERDKMAKSVATSLKQDNLSSKQRSVIESISFKDIETLIEKLNTDKGNSKEDLEDFVLLRLMTPPLRNDLQEVEICKSKKGNAKKNCVVLGKDPELRIVQHKTTSRGGKPIIRKLDTALAADIKNLVSDGRTYLFTNKSGGPYSSSAFTHKFERLFDKHLHKKFGATTLRKLYHTEKTSADMTKMLELKHKIDETAKNMGQSTAVIQSHYIDNKPA
jgi:hypothetical protein